MITITDLETQLEELANGEIEQIEYNAIDFTMFNIALTITYNEIWNSLQCIYQFNDTTIFKDYIDVGHNASEVYAYIMDFIAQIINENFN